MEFIIVLIYKIGTAVCHQIPSRTLHFHDKLLPVCARDTGTYIGFLYSVIYWIGINKTLKGSMPPPYVFITGIIFILTLVIDGGTSYLKLRDTSNEIRLITGLLAGSGAAILILPSVTALLYEYANYDLFIEKKRHFFLWIILLICLFFVIKSGYVYLFYPLTFFICAGILTIMCIVNSVFLALIYPWNKKNIKDIKSFIYFFLPSFLLTIGELFLSYNIHLYINLHYPPG